MFSRDLLWRWCVAFAITQLVECPIWVLGFGATLGIAFAASTLTHPLASLVIPEGWRWIYALAIRRVPSLAVTDLAYEAIGGAMSEAFAFFAEAWLMRRVLGWPLRRALLASACANAASVVAGGVCWLITGWP